MKLKRSNSFFSSIEGRFFLLGLVLLLFFVVYMVFYYLRDSQIAGKLTGMVFAEIFGGRSAGIPLGLQHGIPVFDVVLASVLQDVIILYLCAPLVTVFYGRLDKRKFLGWLIERSRRSAVENRRRGVFKAGFKYLAVVLFIWFPFYMTGTFVGFILATLLGVRVLGALLLASCATIVGAITWAMAFDYILHLMRKVGGAVPVMVIVVILAVVVGLNVRNFFIYLRERRDGRL